MLYDVAGPERNSCRLNERLVKEGPLQLRGRQLRVLNEDLICGGGPGRGRSPSCDRCNCRKRCWGRRRRKRKQKAWNWPLRWTMPTTHVIPEILAGAHGEHVRGVAGVDPLLRVPLEDLHGIERGGLLVAKLHGEASASPHPPTTSPTGLVDAVVPVADDAQGAAHVHVGRRARELHTHGRTPNATVQVLLVNQTLLRNGRPLMPALRSRRTTRALSHEEEKAELINLAKAGGAGAAERLMGTSRLSHKWPTDHSNYALRPCKPCSVAGAQYWDPMHTVLPHEKYCITHAL